MKHNVKLSSLPSLLQGLYLYKHHQYQKAQKIFSKILEKQPKNAYLNFRYGMSLYKDKKWNEANYFIQKAVELAPEQESWKKQLATTERYKNDSSKIKVAENKKNLEKQPNSPEYIWEYAVSLIDSKQYWLAQFQLEKYIELRPDSERAFYQLGIVAEKLANYEQAFSYFQKASQFDPLNRNYKYRMGYNLEKLGHLDQARMCYDLVTSLSNAGDEVIDFGIGALHAKRGLWDLAVSAYLEFQVKTGSQNPELFYRIGLANERLYQWAESATAFEQAVTLSEVINANWCFKCGQAYERAGNFEKSAEFYQEAVKRSDHYNDYWWYRLALVLEKLGKYEQSVSAFQNSRRRKLAYSVNPKNVIKHKEEEYLSYYTEYYETLELDEKLVLIESFFGGNISCNPYAILSYMLGNNYDYTYVVVIKDGTVIPDNLKFNRKIIFIKRGSDAYLRYLCTAKYLINNVSFPYYFIRKEGQIYLNTWHGTPMKTLGKDIKNPFMDHANVSRNFLQATHIISPNRHTTDIILEQYDVKDLFSGKLAETGYPRIDLAFNLTGKRREEIKEKLGLSNKKPVVFYAPTWRGTSQSKDFDTTKLQSDLKKLKSDKYNLIFRGHHLVEQLLETINLDVIVAPKDIDSNELLGFCDLLITDYSSIIYDFLALNKPAISYIYDYEEYDAERGLYLKPEEMSGTVCTTITDVKNAILENIALGKTNVSEQDINKYSYLDDGKATKRTVEFMFDRDDSCVYKYERKKSDIFFEGPFIPNGISRSFLNLMASIKDSEKNITLLINGADIAQDQKRLAEFDNLPSNVTVLSRVGRTPMTLEELWVRNKFEETYQMYSESFTETLLKVYKREVRRLLGDSLFENAIHFEGYSLFWVLLFSQINAKKHIIYQHNDKYKEWKGRFPYLEGVFNSYVFFDQIVSVSEKTMENNILNLSKSFNIPKEKFTFCNNPINIQQILSSAEEDIEMESEFTSFNGQKFINIGRMSHEKDQLKLIEAFCEAKKVHANIRLFILGDGVLKQDLTNKIKELSLEKDVYLLGQKKNPFPYLKQADVFILSSNHEGQPMVLLESLTLGTPIIATDIVGNRSILGDNYGVLVENSKDGLVKGINIYMEQGGRKDSFDPYEYQNDAMAKFYSLLTN
ncbi:CDP-glycerol glycerophosphotransferase family protein [Actinobacillus pleuropneumoniae]|uniref:CDP-glycerol glycerophosphotransferase family protein n=3 Tax=Actinobacillus pleuropneumoniae TaxID=715 RepID=UPI000311E570|nr:CDP-glycerol glycerophosphotransferase family protein [Actinobacillus pleuropneumoniae]MCL7710659.1 CDP-glycerol glycerophosphotransferase family protein [Actinobacillus pleuropneumoniae]MCL7711645.1 CDP-glycerol glycerophosphotransferase family protein [Actinobacillus pleuropneumoniae]MCL7716675.1 CDP-glycerol glycerophosphotransferase family protein [Actinobacillus pleuropneumoniae]MCL7719682.1 CDP-glycerol glycerophosphotransferase family protein [Actinobacillus pleuropneumoniae]MCL77238